MIVKFLAVTAFLALPALAEEAPDPFLAPDSAAPTVEAPAPSLGAPEATPVPAAPSAPEAQAPVPLTSIPGKTAESPGPVPAADTNKGIYDQYEDYLEREKERNASEKDFSQRNMFPHENGAWQLGLIYVRGAFSNYNFNFRDTINNPPKKLFADTTGANLDITWFPLKSLTFGRLGFGAVGGMYWSTFETTTTSFLDTNGTSSGSTVTKATPQEIVSYGVRAVYEFDYWLGQILVPFVFVGVDNMIIKGYSVRVAQQTTSVPFIDFPTRRIASQNYGGGVHFNLNRVEPTVASKALASLSVRKFYLTYMANQRSGEMAGVTHNLGLNFEF